MMADESIRPAATEALAGNAPSDVEKSAQQAEPPLPKDQAASQTQQNVQYSAFTVNQKRSIVAMGSCASFFSPLSSSIYFPALETIATALQVSTSKINLTVTTYLIMQGFAPMFIAGFSDSAGRRPAYYICFTIYIAANLGLSLQNSYAALMVLRCLQSAGSSGTVALANGLVGDMITSAERGSYIAFASVSSMLGPSLSPILGGLLSQYLDWHWIFWFLTIFGGSFAVVLFLFMPETCRKVVGDGSVPPPPLNNSVTDMIRYRRRKKRGIEVDQVKLAELRKNYRFHLPSPVSTFHVVLDPETAIILLTLGLQNCVFYAVVTGATSSFQTIYKFNDIQTALMYLPIGCGGILSAFTTGQIVDWNYRRHAKRSGMTIVKGVRQDLTNFNVERVRLEIALPTFYISLAMVIMYGWLMGRKVNIAAPIILLFVSGWALNATSQCLSALMVDLWPGNSAAATAAANLFRCELGAGSSAVIGPMVDAMGQGWAYTTLVLISVATSPAYWFIMKHGIKMRQKRLSRQKKT